MYYFKNDKNGEIHELRHDLHSDRKSLRKETLKRIVRNSTIGKDMSELFPDVVNMIQTQDTEQKKLVYLYLTNYSSTNQDLALLAVNTFIKDCEDPDPLVRSLAVRAMGCIHVKNILAYLCEPLRSCLEDPDPYVRKTSALCVLKLFKYDPECVISQGFMNQLQNLLMDPNPMVLTNTLAVLLEMCQSSDLFHDYLKFNHEMITKLLSVMNECTEWGQITVLDSLVYYDCANDTEAQNICERVIARLSHANTAVVLSSIKILLKNIKYFAANNTFKETIFHKVGQSLLSMLNQEPEIKYVALRNINLIAQKYPEILRKKYKSFAVKYNDPIYIKYEKLEIINMLIDSENVHEILKELVEYTAEVDVDFVKRAIRSIGICAIKVESALDKCFSILIELIQMRISHVFQEAVIVATNLLRRFENKNKEIIDEICQNTLTFDNLEAKSAFIWLLGEYCVQIPNSLELLIPFIHSFLDESYTNQLQIITSIVKIFLYKPGQAQPFLSMVLDMSINQVDNLDVRDRALVYSKLLSQDLSTAKEVILVKKPPISSSLEMKNEQIDNLLLNISSLSSIYHTLPRNYKNYSFNIKTSENLANENSKLFYSDTSLDTDTTFQNELNISTFNSPIDLLFNFPASGNENHKNLEHKNSSYNIDALNDLFADIYVDTRPINTVSNSSSKLWLPNKSLWLSQETTKSIEIYGTIIKMQDIISVELDIKNRSQTPSSSISIEFRPNYFDLQTASPFKLHQTIDPGESKSIVIELDFKNPFPDQSHKSKLLCDDIQSVPVSIEYDTHTYDCHVFFPIHFYFTDLVPINNSPLDESMFFKQWDLLKFSDYSFLISRTCADDEIRHTLNSLCINLIKCSEKSFIAGFCRLRNDSSAYILIEMSDVTLNVRVRSENSAIVLSIHSLIVQILKLLNQLD